MKKVKILKLNDNSSLEILRDEVNNRLKDIEKDFGVSMKVGHISYQQLKATFRLDATIASVDVSKIDYEKYCGFFDIPKDSYGKTFISGGTTYKICGINIKARKFPIVAQNLKDNKMYKFNNVDIVKLIK
ncbi:hypothetical protein M0Q50_03500 [bacterium]|jgi:hypothetical protein|nr:hypothetical protein [bacterium]